MFLAGFVGRIANVNDGGDLEPDFEHTLSIDVCFFGMMSNNI